MTIRKTIEIKSLRDIESAYDQAISEYALEESDYGDVRLIYIKFDRENKRYTCAFEFARHYNHDGVPNFTE